VSELRALAKRASSSEDSIAINRAILKYAPQDVVAANRLGRAYEALRLLDAAADAFLQVLAIDSENAIAKRRLRDVERRLR
jgi:predicted TPR repeat methyltransferase